MRLSQLVAELAPAESLGPDVDVSAVCYDSRRAGPGALFVAVPGFRTDGHDHIAEAAARGAVAVAVQPDRPQKWRAVVEERGLAAVVVSDFEARRPGPSFTVETLESLAERYPGEVWRLLIGADNLEEFLRWRQPARLLQLADLLVFPRGEAVVALAPELRRRAKIVADFACPAASTGVRAALAAGRRPTGLMPPTVLAYIERHGLYGCAPAGGSDEGARCP